MKLSEKKIEEEKKKSLTYSIKEGGAASVMEGAGNSYISPFAIALNASNSQVGMLASIPSILSPLAQLITAKFVRKIKSRRDLIGLFVLIQALLWIPIILLPFIIKTNQVTYLIILFGILTMSGSFIGPIWASLISDLVNAEDRGKYFGKRNSITGSVAIAFTFIVAFILDAFTSKLFIAFSVVFLFALLGRLLSYYYLRKHYDPEITVSQEQYFTFTQFLKRVPFTNFGKFTVYFSLINFGTFIAAPFFTVYMLRTLEFTYSQYTIVLMTAAIASLIGMRVWGKLGDEFGNVRILKLLGVAVSIAPMLWIFSNNIYYLILVQIFAGFTWGGFTLCASNFIYDNVKREKRALVISYYNVVNGIMIFFGASLGGYLLSNLDLKFMKTIFFIFLLSGFVRFIAHVIFSNKLHEKRDVKHLNHAFELINVMPMQGLVHEVVGVLYRRKRKKK